MVVALSGSRRPFASPLGKARSRIFRPGQERGLLLHERPPAARAGLSVGARSRCGSCSPAPGRLSGVDAERGGRVLGPVRLPA